VNVLHLSDSPLSGAPIRIVELLNKYSQFKARHIVWDNIPRSQPWRRYRTDLRGRDLTADQLHEWLDWADVLHFHNRWKRQEIFKFLKQAPPKKPGVIQIHSPRESEGFLEEAASGLPLAIVGQYHPRQWLKEMRYIVPNVVDVNSVEYDYPKRPLRKSPVVSYAPSNCNGKGWDSKSYLDVSPILKRMHLANIIYYQLIIQQPHEKVIEMKRNADIGIDEITTGSYHISSLEYLALGIPCFANVDKMTFDVIRQMTGCESLPWIIANPGNFKMKLDKIIKEQSWQELGEQSRIWMEKYWAPERLVEQYMQMYEDL